MAGLPLAIGQNGLAAGHDDGADARRVLQRARPRAARAACHARERSRCATHGHPMMPKRRHAFTLLEVLMALAAGAVILTAIYGVFSKAVHLRDSATDRAREVRVRARAVSILRNDLRNARISGGELAATLQG